MKRILVGLCGVFLSASVASAAVYLDGMAAYTNAGEAETMLGFGAGVGFQAGENINIFIRGLAHSKTEDANTADEAGYRHDMVMGVFEYAYAFSEVPFHWIASLGVGMTKTGVERKNLMIELSETGVAFGAWTGFLWMATQHIAPYLQVGYHKSMYADDFEGENVGGYQVLFGVRFTLFGRNRSIDSDY
ncbi:MAG TPA: hypothetical protein VLM75_12395 [Spirochaetota bacterium]|nr:hypothetical protein [Spirochaetota bacterium]